MTIAYDSRSFARARVAAATARNRRVTPVTRADRLDLRGEDVAGAALGADECRLALVGLDLPARPLSARELATSLARVFQP